MKNKKLAILLIGLIIILTGCLPSKEIEGLGIINTRGIDTLDDGNLETTIVYFQFDKQSKNITKIVSGQGKTVKGARTNANFKTNFELTAGQIRLEIYGREAAEKGILPYLDTLGRDAKVADTMFLAVSDTTAKDVIKMGQKDPQTNVGHYLYRLIEQSIIHDVVPRMTLQDFIHAFYDVGKDPIMPILKISKKRPYLYAVGLFKNDQLVGQIPAEDAFLINMLEKKVKTTQLELELPLKPFEKYIQKPGGKKSDEKTFSVLISVLNGKGKMDVVDMNSLTFKTDIQMELRLLELTKEIRIKSPKVRALFEKEIEKSIAKQYQDLLANVQELGVDPFGYGNVYRVHKKNGELKSKEWRNILPDINVKFHVDAKIVQHGITK
ncbi:Ger(x)C family spore germination protein [Virgibacillus phasianinus]|uniref:Ger(x)C family spore germination protein n=1 Tax=Virgibacillus phasianinus TaxID=2017483 RepID=UPI0012FE665B|nr:Ger(x)C family spore germination protein [Virgibacillus phasianinus]